MTQKPKKTKLVHQMEAVMRQPIRRIPSPDSDAVSGVWHGGPLRTCFNWFALGDPHYALIEDRSFHYVRGDTTTTDNPHAQRLRDGMFPLTQLEL